MEPTRTSCIVELEDGGLRLAGNRRSYPSLTLYSVDDDDELL
jgi:hypothetical protein